MTGAAATTSAAVARVHLDALGGVAGDMFVAALLDAFPALTPRVLADAAAVLPAEAGQAVLEEGQSGGLRARRFRLAAPGAGAPAAHHHGTGSASHDHGTSHAALAARIRAAPLAEGTAAEALAILGLLAGAEARIHGVAPEAVHFHEVGDWDSLMDVVAAGSIAAALPGAVWSVSSLPRGGGRVTTAHGPLPVPAPATLALLEGFDWHDDGIAGERVTPTGAAILRHLCAPGAAPAAGRLLASGSGAGSRTLPGCANILRATAFAASGAAQGADTVLCLSFDIDDMTGEEIAVAAAHLRAVPGVRDLVLLGGQGKKGRPLTRFELLLAPDALDTVSAACFRETSTLGLRWRTEQRRLLPRRAAAAGGLRLKAVLRPDGGETVKAESDDLAPLQGLAARRAAAAAACGALPADGAGGAEGADDGR